MSNLPYAQEEPGQSKRFEVWVRGMRVWSSDFDCFTTVFVDGEEVFNLEAQIEFEAEDERSWGEAPQVKGLAVDAAARTLRGDKTHDLGRREWKLLKAAETPADEVSKRERPK